MELVRALKSDRAYPLLFAVVLVALALRITTMRFDNYLLGGDSWYHFKIASILLETGEYPMWEYYTRYPFGEPVLAPPGFYYLPVVLYELLAITGVSFFNVFKALPALIGFLAVVPLYLLVKETFSRKIGIAAALFYAISPAGIERGLAGFYRGEVFLVFSMLFVLYFFVLSIKRDLYFSLLAGFFLFLGGLLWNGWPIAFGTLSAVAVLGVFQNYIVGSSSNKVVASYGISSCLGVASLYFFRSGFYRYEPALKETGGLILGFKIILLAVLVLMVTTYIGTRLKEKRGLRLATVALLFLTLSGAVYFSGYLETINDYSRFFDTSKGVALKETTTYVWRTGITEQAKMTPERLIYTYNIMLFLSPLGLVYFLREKNGLAMPLVIGFALSTLPLLILQIRFLFLGAFPLSIMSALALAVFLQTRKRHLRNTATAFLIILFYLNILTAIAYTSSARPLVSESLYDGLKWTRENTPEDAVILAWWDYSGPIAAIADRRSIAHTAPSGVVESFALLLRTSNETQAIEIFRSLNEDFSLRDMRADYLIVDTRSYLLWPKILQFQPYVNYQAKVVNTELENSMLHRLYTGEGRAGFELVYANEDFRLYKPLFNYTKISEIEAPRYLKSVEPPEFFVNIKSNEMDSVILKTSVTKKKESVFQKTEEVKTNLRYELKLPNDLPLEKGNYKLTAELYTSAGKKLHTYSREFIII